VADGNPAGGFVFTPETIEPGVDSKSTAKFNDITGHLTLDVSSVTTNTALTDYFGESVVDNERYYTLNTDLSVKPLQEKYIAAPSSYAELLLGTKLPIKGSVGLEFRNEPNGDTKIKIPAGAVLPEWFVRTMNERFEVLPVGVRVYDPANPSSGATGLDANASALAPTLQQTVRDIKASNPGNVVPVIGNDSLLTTFLDNTRFSAVPGTNVDFDARAFDVAFRPFENAINELGNRRRLPTNDADGTRITFPDIYGALVGPSELMPSKTRLRVGVSTGSELSTPQDIGSVIVPSVNIGLTGEVIYQKLDTGVKPRTSVSDWQNTLEVTPVTNSAGRTRVLMAPDWIPQWVNAGENRGVLGAAAQSLPLPMGGKQALVEYAKAAEIGLTQQILDGNPNPANATTLETVKRFRQAAEADFKDGAPLKANELEDLKTVFQQLGDSSLSRRASSSERDWGLNPGISPTDPNRNLPPP
jgi:hypothetical protein